MSVPKCLFFCSRIWRPWPAFLAGCSQGYPAQNFRTHQRTLFLLTPYTSDNPRTKAACGLLLCVIRADVPVVSSTNTKSGKNLSGSSCRRVRSEIPHFPSKLQLFVLVLGEWGEKRRTEKKAKKTKKNKKSEENEKKGKIPPTPSTPTPLITSQRTQTWGNGSVQLLSRTRKKNEDFACGEDSNHDEALATADVLVLFLCNLRKKVTDSGKSTEIQLFIGRSNLILLIS